MKIDQISENDYSEPQSITGVSKSNKGITIIDNNQTVMDLLNPLKQINLSSNLHSFYNYKNLQKQVEVLMRTQANLIFYILHQNFMCDEKHKEFFKNMVGRFYDLPEWSWRYYQGTKYINKTMIGLILTENLHYYNKYNSTNNSFEEYHFSSKQRDKFQCITHFNKLALEEYWGGTFDNHCCCYFSPFNIIRPQNDCATWAHRIEPATFESYYEFGRFSTLKWKVKRTNEKELQNYWFIATYDWIHNSEEVENDISYAVQHDGVYASLGLDNFDKIIHSFKERAQVSNLGWDDLWIPNWEEDDCKIIRSLSQTFPWTKDYIFQNEEKLNLDVLGLNMSVPWDMELVKFFIERGYGGRMSENKAVFDKVFEPLLTDEIIKKLFYCEYEPYE